MDSTILRTSDRKPQVTPIRFISWGNTKTGTGILAVLSTQAQTYNPNFTIYTGDLEDNGFTTTGMDTWKTALNGNNSNGMYSRTFAVRGNHDDSINGSITGWAGYFNFQATAQQIGATNYTAMDPQLTYSFDYGNSHFVGIDVPGDSSLITSAKITWLDNDLTPS
jgi:hypothetical protein